MSELTIVSANYLSKSYLELNYKLSRQVYDDFDWLVVKNDHKQEFDDRFISIAGAERPQAMTTNVNHASHHHAMALNLAIPHIKTRFVLFLDPDFFVAVSHGDIISHMKDKGLSFFGSPYSDNGQWRPVTYFPVAFCMYVDTERVDISKFDFVPGMQPDKNKWYDTGHKIYEKYVHSHHKFEITTEASTKNKYLWNLKTFGFHVRTKLHLRDEESIRQMTALHIEQIEKAVRIIRNE